MAQTLLDIDGLNAVLATALDAVVVMDGEGLVRGWNAVAEETFGLAAADVAGKRMSETIIPERFRAAHETGLEHFLATGEGPVLDRHFEIEALCSDGREIPIELSITFSAHFGQPLFIGFLRDISERRRAEATRKLLIDELNHRVKNLLGVVSGIAYQTLRNAPSLEAFADEFTGRLSALARSHEILTAENWKQGSLRQLLATLTQPVDAGGERISCEGPDLALAPKELLAMAMIVHELLVNALKYGALSRPGGRVAICWRQDEGVVAFDWREAGCGPIAAPPERRGFGSRMIEFSARHDLGGAASWDWSGDGVAFHVRFTPRSSGARQERGP